MPDEIKRIVLTPAQNPFFFDQSIAVMKYIKGRFPGAEGIVSFHRGLGEADEYTPESDAVNTRKLADAAVALGFEPVEVAYDANKLKVYDTCDLHIGYRVHDHLYFLSKRRPSILIHGVTELRKSPGIDAYKVSKPLALAFGTFKNKFVYG